MNKQLTGRFCHKPNFWGNLVLYVEVSAHNLEDDFYYTYWRLGTFEDLVDLKFY